MKKKTIALTLAGGLALLGAATADTPAPPAGAAWQNVECIPADPTTEESFTVARSLDDCEDPAVKWTVAAGGQQAAASVRHDTGAHHGGHAALRLDYDFVGKKDYEYVQLNGAAGFAEAGLGFGFWLKGDGTPFALRLRTIDAGGECHQTELSGSCEPGWHFIAGALDSHSTAWGGDGNKRRDYPCTLAGICIDRPQVGFTGKGSLWIDDVAVLRPVTRTTRAIKVVTPDRRFGNLYALDNTVALRASGEGELLRWSVRDFFGRELARGEGPTAGTEARFTLAGSGWFSCRFELLDGGSVVGTHSFPCAALPGGAESARSDFFGVCSHYGQEAYPLKTMELMRRYGVDQFRDEILWSHCETDPGRVTVPPFCMDYLHRAAELKLRPLIIFDYNNRFYDHGGFPNSPEAIAGFTRYAVELARQTRGLVDMFEVWNEWVGGCGMNGQPGTHDGEAYGRLLQPTYAAVKREFPEVTVVGIGGEYGAHCAENIAGAIRSAGPDAMDAWSIHPYRYPHSPEYSNLLGEVGRIAATVAGAGAKSRAWITEIGYPTHRGSGGSTEPAQARHCVRTLALLQSMPQVAKVFWYDLKDDGLTRDYNEHNFGLIHHQQFNCAPKPAMVAASVFIRMTGGAAPAGLTTNGDTHAAAYRRGDQHEVVVAWSTARGSTRSAWIGEITSIIDLMGNPRPVPETLELTGDPVYLVGSNIKLVPTP